MPNRAFREIVTRLAPSVPGAPNVIPGKVVASLELRDLVAEKITLLFNQISKKAIAIGEETNTEFTFIPLDATAAPALTDTRIQEIIRQNAAQLGYTPLDEGQSLNHDQCVLQT